MSGKRHQARQRSGCSHQNASQNWSRQIAHPRYSRCAPVAALHALVAHALRAAIQLADRCMRACGTSFHAAVASSLLSRLVKVRQFFCLKLCFVQRAPPFFPDWPRCAFARRCHIAAAVGVLPLRAGLGHRAASSPGPVCGGRPSSCCKECRRCPHDAARRATVAKKRSSSRRNVQRRLAVIRVHRYILRQRQHHVRAVLIYPLCVHVVVTQYLGPPLLRRAHKGVSVAPPSPFALSTPFSKILIWTFWMRRLLLFHATCPYRRPYGEGVGMLGVTQQRRRICPWDKGRQERLICVVALHFVTRFQAFSSRSKHSTPTICLTATRQQSPSSASGSCLSALR